MRPDSKLYEPSTQCHQYKAISLMIAHCPAWDEQGSVLARELDL